MPWPVFAGGGSCCGSCSGELVCVGLSVYYGSVQSIFRVPSGGRGGDRRAEASRTENGEGRNTPLGLGLCKGLALGVIADYANVDITAQVELLGSEHGHFGGERVWACRR